MCQGHATARAHAYTAIRGGLAVTGRFDTGATSPSPVCPGRPARQPHRRAIASQRCPLQIIDECGGGLAVHTKRIVACLLHNHTAGQCQPEVRPFGPMTQDLWALGDWWQAACWTHVAMESTGVDWQPAFNLLEDLFEVLVVTAPHVKEVPRAADRG